MDVKSNNSVFTVPENKHGLSLFYPATNMDFRISYGEMITGSSWLMRDLWQITNMNYGAR